VVKQSTVKAAHKVIELTENLQQLVVAGDLLGAAEEVQRKEAACSEANALEATRGNTDSHNISNVIEIESSSTSTSTSSDIDNIPLSRVYASIHKSLSPSPSTKHQKKPDDDAFVPMYPFVLERIGEMSQMRVDVCKGLPANHPFQPPMIEPLQSIPADVEVEGEPTVPESVNHEESSSSHPKPTTQTSDPSVLVELANHYSGELPEFESNLERSSEASSDEVTLESPQQQAPNLQMASNTCTDLIIHPVYQTYYLNATHSNISLGIALRNFANKNVSSHILFSYENPSSEQPTLIVQPLSVAPPSKATFVSQTHNVNPTEPEQTHQWFRPGFLNQSLGSSSTSALESVLDQPSEPSTQMAVTENTATYLPSSSTQAYQTCTPIQTTNISSPPTLFLDSIILADVCESIFKELNKLVKARNNFVHEEDYVKEWRRLREKVDVVMSELQKSSLEAHNNA